jgi:hypothetical protein
MSLDVTGIVSEVSSHLKRLGIFSTVTTHEPKSTPKKGLTASVWVNSVGPSPANSGLSKTSVRIELSIRLLLPMLTDPQDDIDLSLLRATDAVMNSFSSDYTLSGAVESIDLLGRTGSGLSAETGYLQIDSNQIMRVMDITVPLLINDNWDQVP